MKRLFVCICGLLIAATALAVSALYAQDATSIVDAARNRIKSNTVSTRSRMVISVKDGSTSECLIDQYAKDGTVANYYMIRS
jgi:hypothetical protein